MANEISLFRDQPNPVPAAARGLDEITKRLLGNTSYKRISIRGKKFRMMANGQEAAKAPGNSLEIVVVNAAPAVSRHFYSKVYDPAAKELPDCWSNDGVRPDPKSVAPQGKTCDTCPKNRQGSGTNGSRACKFSRRLAVVLANDVRSSDVYQLQLPATSIFGKGTDDNLPLDAYVKKLFAYNYSITGVVTELSFDDDSDSPKLFFRALRSLEPEESEVVLARSLSPEAEAAITFNPAQMDNANSPSAPTEALFKASPTAPAATPKPDVKAAEPSEPTVRQSKNKPAEPPAEPENFDAMIDDWSEDD